MRHPEGTLADQGVGTFRVTELLPARLPPLPSWGETVGHLVRPHHSPLLQVISAVLKPPLVDGRAQGPWGNGASVEIWACILQQRGTWVALSPEGQAENMSSPLYHCPVPVMMWLSTTVPGRGLQT